MPQLPQLLTSWLTSRHPLGQRAKPAAQVHAPATHPEPGGQTVPQTPQWFGSLVKSTQTPSHNVRPAVQVAMAGAAESVPLAPGEGWLTGSEELVPAPGVLSTDELPPTSDVVWTA